MSRAIPERQPIHDIIQGYLLNVGEGKRHFALALNPPKITQNMQHGQFVVRYAIPYLGKPHYAIVPDLVALDYGDILTGEEAWNFLLKRSNLHPRADVLGYRNDGVDEQVTVKMLDLALPIQVYLYESVDTRIPICQLEAIIASEETPSIARICQYLVRYNDDKAWLETLSV
ncbi:MAG: hypothetical protein D6712_03960 [Chloroflexi bacterium]|nr:MAG: hypothetical protein D6712_03960 [Chloroflexota bacterium]